jgi:hypothetical protein
MEFIQTVLDKATGFDLKDITIRAYQDNEMVEYSLEDFEGFTIEEKLTTALNTLNEFIFVGFPDGDRIFK